MKNVKAAAKDDFHIIVYENWKNIRTIWNEMEKYWKIKNMLVWHLPNRVQGFAGKYKFFSKHDIAMVGSSYDNESLNDEAEKELLQNEYETALYAISGRPHWEGYEKGKKICPTDFITPRLLMKKAPDKESSLAQNLLRFSSHISKCLQNAVISLSNPSAGAGRHLLPRLK